MLWTVWLLDLLNYADWRDRHGTIILVVLSLSRIPCTNVTVHCYHAKARAHIGRSGRRGHVRSQTQITQFGAAPCGHRANQVSDHKTVLHAYLAWVGHVA